MLASSRYCTDGVDQLLYCFSSNHKEGSICEDADTGHIVGLIICITSRCSRIAPILLIAAYTIVLARAALFTFCSTEVASLKDSDSSFGGSMLHELHEYTTSVLNTWVPCTDTAADSICQSAPSLC